MKFFIIPVNPEPWRVGPLSVGRRGGKIYPQIGRSQEMEAFQEAVREHLPKQPWNNDIRLEFWFWRNDNSTDRKHAADTTNLQKATEDALQGYLIKNDNQVRDVSSVLVEQGPNVNGKLVVGISYYVPSSPPLPPEVMEELEKLDKQPVSEASDLSHDRNVEEVF